MRIAFCPKVYPVKLCFVWFYSKYAVCYHLKAK